MNLRDKLDRYIKAEVNISPPLEPSPALHQVEHSVHVFPRDHWHGSFNVASLQSRFSHSPRLLLPQLGQEGLDFSRIAFIDTETTGLSGGVGVCAFLVGIGSFSGDGFAVEQFYMQDYPAERSMLAMVCQRLAEFDLIASYNGRSFDIPILEGRLVLNGIRHAISSNPHLDLLHTARRLWKHRLNDCSLKNLENRVIGCQREDDIDGWMIPEAYFSYLRTQKKDLMERILLHNRLDVLSLACVANFALRLIDIPRGAPLEHGEDWYGLGTIFERRRRMEEAVYCFERAIQAGLPEPLGRQCRRSLSFSHKRAGNWEEAARLWKETSVAGGPSRILELEELAKYYEHRLCDLVSAREVCRRAITTLEIKLATASEDVSEDLMRFEHRLKRVERKIQRERPCAQGESLRRHFFS